jgi:glycosyltransferase involved in cell wall biosynthesis
VIFIADHIRELMPPEQLNLINLEKTQFHTIPCGIDLNRYKFNIRQPGFDIAVISERWISKGTDLILQIALKLKQIDERYKIHWLGQRSDANWEYAYLDEFVEHHGLNIEFTNVLQEGETVDDWLEGKNYLLHASHKEAFSYATGEAMAKGIKPVLHRFFGADGLWPGMTWDTIDQAIAMITEDKYDSASYRQYLIDHGYTVDQMMEEIIKVIERE